MATSCGVLASVTASAGLVAQDGGGHQEGAILSQGVLELDRLGSSDTAGLACPEPAMIVIEGLRFAACHGVLPQEGLEPQAFVVDVLLSMDVYPAAMSDDLAATVDYGQVARVVAAVLGGPRHLLIESLAGTVAMEILRAFPLVVKGVVIVHKPAAPLGLPFGDVRVRFPFARMGNRVTGEGASYAGLSLSGE